MLRFTNISRDDMLDMPIYINKDYIISVYEQPTNSGSLRTCVYGIGNNNWYVEESLKEVLKAIEESE